MRRFKHAAIAAAFLVAMLASGCTSTSGPFGSATGQGTPTGPATGTGKVTALGKVTTGELVTPSIEDQPGQLGTPAAQASYQPYPRLTMFSIARPWLVVMCKFADVPDEPPYLTQMAQDLFTSAGAGTGNLYDYYSDVSYGAIDFSGSRVVGWYTAPFKKSELSGGSQRAEQVRECAQQVPASQVDFRHYWGVIMVTNVPNQIGGCYDGQAPMLINGTAYPLACVIMDPASMNVTGTGHEVGHGLGLDHGYDNNTHKTCGSSTIGEYCDQWDVMGDWAGTTFQSTPFPTNPQERAAYPPNAGPGLTAPQLLTMGWIPSGRIATYRIGDALQTITLTALSHPAGNNPLVAQIVGANPDDIYTVEYRQKDGWDTGLPHNTVLIHEYKPQEAARHQKPYSILQLNPTTANGEWQPGDTWENLPGGVTVYVKQIDAASGTATITIQSSGLFQPIDANTVYVEGTDGKLWLVHGPLFMSPFGGGTPLNRQQVDGNVLAFHALGPNSALVLGADHKLWLEHGPWGAVPPARQQIDGNVLAFQALDTQDIYVLGMDHKLWLEIGPWGSVPPLRVQVDGNVLAFQALNGNAAYVEGTDGKLWLENGVWGAVPPQRVQVDGNVQAFQALDNHSVYVVGIDRKLWLEHAPFGAVPPARQQVDGSVQAFQPLDANTVYVVGYDRKLWLEQGPWGAVPPARQQVDGNVQASRALDTNTAFVEGTDGNLWLEHGPWGSVPPPRQQVDGNV